MAFKNDRQRKKVMAELSKNNPLNKYKSIADLPDTYGAKTIDDIFSRHVAEPMTVQEAKELLGDRASWELKNMKRALSMSVLLNTPEEDRRLKAVTVLLNVKK